jgi:hypothetical protein
VEGLSQLAGEHSSVARALRQYQDKRIGELVFQLNTFRYKLDESGQGMDIDRALEAFLEKQAASAIDQSSYRDKNAGAGLRTLRNTDSVADLTLKLFSDPSADAYAEQLLKNRFNAILAKPITLHQLTRCFEELLFEVLHFMLVCVIPDSFR